MNTNSKHIAEQLRLAADIIETGHPFKFGSGTTWNRVFDCTLFDCLKGGYEIRPVLATPPDGRPLHNPDNLTAEQVGVGYRLALPEEMDGRFRNGRDKCEWWSHGQGWRSTSQVFAHKCPTDTLRLPLSVPWPKPADPYAELKKAHAAGKEIQYRDASTGGVWQTCTSPGWFNDAEYRIKPEPAFQLPPPPPGMRWHREDEWKADDLPQGYRPLVEGDRVGVDSEIKIEKSWECSDGSIQTATGVWNVNHYRTRRPLTFKHAGKTWTWHRPGDTMPCDGGREVVTLLEDLDIGGTIRAGRFDWSKRDDGEQIIGWRYADEKKTVPLGPEDAPPGSVFRGAGEAKDPNDKGWCLVTSCSTTGIRYWRQSDSDPAELPWKTLHESGAQINRSFPLTGKWNPDAWEPCSKEVYA